LAEEKIAIEQACNEAIKKAQEDLTAFTQQQLEMKLSSFSTLFNGFGQLFETLGEKNRGFAIAAKAMASAEAGINTALAFTKALASGFPPFNFIAAAGVAAAGIAQQVKIISTPIPSAETGGRFIVPNSVGVDSQIMKVNPGEQVDVTPRGMTSQQESFNFNFIIDGHVFAEITNKLARSGELHTLQLAGNY
jgi:hypothetical protein